MLRCIYLLLLYVQRRAFESGIYPSGLVVDLCHPILLWYVPDTNLKKFNTVIGEPVLTTRNPISFLSVVNIVVLTVLVRFWSMILSEMVANRVGFLQTQISKGPRKSGTLSYNLFPYTLKGLYPTVMVYDGRDGT